MKLETFFKHFDLLAEAPNGVQKLRELILDLAVRGKLVPQDANDEPAAVLLERIKKEKERLVKEGKVKKEKSLPAIKDNEIPYDLPKSWEWVKLDYICSYIQRGKSPKYVDKSDFPVIAQKCIQWHGIELQKAKFICPESVEKYSDERFLETGDLLLNSTGTGTLGRVCIYIHEENIYKKVVADSHVTVIRPILIESKFIYFWIASDFVQSEIEAKSSGSTKQIELATSTVKNYLFPLPPLNEQKRIVTKVDELMKLCDELEARQKKKQETRILINNAALNKLLTAETPETFTKNWQRISDNFDLLYSAPENIGKLRQAILQLAVMGKLVPQNANDEPAAVLLERIKKEKERLIKEGKVKKEKSLPAIKDDEIFYQLPNNWRWTKIGNLCLSIVPNRDKPKSFSGGYPWITLSNFDENKIELINNHSGLGLSDSEVREYNARIIPNGSVIMSCVGRFGLVVVIDKDVVTNQQIHGFVVPASLNSKYLAYVIKSQKQFLDESAKSTTISYLNKTRCESIPIPLPPLAEQKRIVTKVDKLMKLCDELETKLTQTQTEREKIINAAVKQLLTV